MKKLIPLNKRNALRVALIAGPILEKHGLTDLEYDRPAHEIDTKELPSTLFWRANRRWMTRKKREWKTVTYVVLHYPREDRYEALMDHEYALEVVRQLDEMLYEEAFQRADLTADDHAKKRARDRANREKYRMKKLEQKNEPPKPRTEDWDSF